MELQGVIQDGVPGIITSPVETEYFFIRDGSHWIISFVALSWSVYKLLSEERGMDSIVACFLICSESLSRMVTWSP